jgi:putative membrane protein
MTHEALASVGDSLAALNATLNGTAAVLLLAGRIAVAQRRTKLHRALMLSAFGVSTAFLVSYLTRVALTGTHVDPHHGWVHAAYYAILGSHMLLAVLVVPLVLVTLLYAYRKRFAKHRALARWTFPVWLYVSVTGVVVYLVLYKVPA